MHRSTLALILTTVSLAVAVPRPDEGSEPPQRFRLDIDGKEYVLASGDATKIKIRGREHEFTVEPQSTRRLELAEFGFDYPQELEFSFAGVAPVETWTLRGDGLTLTLYRLEGMSGGDFQETLLKTLSEASKPKKIELRLGGKKAKGLSAQWEQSSLISHYESYTFRAEGPDEFLLTMQSFLQEDVAPEALANMRTQLRKSFTFAK